MAEENSKKRASDGRDGMDSTFYSRRQAARLARVPYSTLTRWVRDGVVTPTIRVLAADGSVVSEGFSLADVGYLHLLRLLTDHGVSLEDGVLLLHHLVSRFGPPGPSWVKAGISVKPKAKNGTNVYAFMEDGWDLTLAVPGQEGAGQRAIEELLHILPLDVTLQNLLIPSDFQYAVEIDPKRANGLPVCRGTNVRTSVVHDLLKRMPVGTVQSEYFPHVNVETLLGAHDFEADLDKAA